MQRIYKCQIKQIDKLQKQEYDNSKSRENQHESKITSVKSEYVLVLQTYFLITASQKKWAAQL